MVAWYLIDCPAFTAAARNKQRYSADALFLQAAVRCVCAFIAYWCLDM